MTSFYTFSGKLRQLPILLAGLLFFAAHSGWAQTPYPLSAGPYTESFSDIAGWTSGFAAGTGASRFGVAAPDPALPNTNTVFTSSTSGGVQRGTGAIVLLATGADGANASAFDLYLDFTGRAAGTISLDWAEVNNSTGNRQSTFKLQTSTAPTGGFVDLPQTAIVITNNQASAGRLTVALPAAFTNQGRAKVRFYLAATAGGTVPAGSRPKMSLDNLEVTSTAAEGPAAATITTGAVAPASFCVTGTAASPAFEVAFASSGTFNGPYSVQLSDASGVFPASPDAGLIGSGGASPIAAAIPAGTASGTKYRVRVLSAAPATTGSANAADLSVTLTPATNPVMVSPAEAQAVTTTGTGTTLTATGSTGSTGSTFAWFSATSAGGPFTALPGATAASYQVKGADFPGAGTYFLVAQATLSTSCGTVAGTSDPVALTIATPTPTSALSVSQASLPDFGRVITDAASAYKSFTVSAEYLSGPLTLTPPAGFEIRTGAAAFACCAIVLTPVDGAVPATTIDVRFAPTAALAYQGAIPVSSAGLPEQSVAVAGTGTGAVYPATLGTTAVSGLTPTGAATGGSVATDGGSPVTARGVVWATTSNPTTSALTKTADGAGSGEFSSAITGLLPGTTYFVRAYATTAISTAYGEELTFTTVAVPLAAEPTTPATLAASQVSSTTLQLDLAGGDGQKRLVLARLGAPVDATPADATTYLADPVFGKGSQLGKGNFVVYNGRADSVVVTGLRPSTPYYFTVFAFSDNDTPYAENYLTTAPGTLSQATLAVPAALLLEENFDYPAGALLTANSWTAHSGTTRPIAVAATGLSLPGYGAASGNAAAVVANGEDVSRAFGPIYARTPVYVSFLVNVASVTTTGDYFFHLGPKPIGTIFRSRVSVRKDAAGKLQFGITGGAGAISYTPAQYELNTPYLVVVKYSFDEASNVSQLFINPTTDTEPATASATATETGSTPVAPNDNIGSIALRQGTNSPNLVVDGIRVGTSYRVVRTGLLCLPPRPAFTAAPVCVGAPTAFADASATVEANATYAWDVDGDGTVNYTTAGSFTHQYAAAGTYTATLTITQGACSETTTQSVIVRALPTAALSGDATVCAGTAAPLRVQLTGTAPLTLGYSADGGATTTSLTISAADVDTTGTYWLAVTPKTTTTYSLISLTDANCAATTPTGTATVSVTTPPALTVPAGLRALTSADQCGAAVPFAATATGAPAPAITYAIGAQAIAPGYLFPVGTTTVTATATNSCGTDSRTFTVTVRDQQAPTVQTRNLAVALVNGTATITPAQVDGGSFDACSVASLALSQTTFSCANIGANTVTLTVTDVHGNVARQPATITVTGTIPTPAIAVTPSSTVYTGGVPTTLYLGYGPQSLTLSASGGARYQWSPAAGLSSASIANPVFTATAAGRFTFTLTATSASGCTATKSITLTVIDARCGPKNDKVNVCHKGQVQCLVVKDVADHLSHGDQLGTCAPTKGAPAMASALQARPPAAEALAAPLLLEAYPNPFTEQTVLRFRPISTGPARLQLYNALGQVVQTLYEGPVRAGQLYQFTIGGAALPQGLYTSRLQVGGQVQSLRLQLNK